MLPPFARRVLLFAALVGLSGCVRDGAEPASVPAPASPTQTALDPAAAPTPTTTSAPTPPSPTGAPEENGTAAAPPPEPPYSPGWPAIEAAVVRPGVKLYDPLETQLARGDYGACTAAFVLSSLDNRTLYVATASHCVTGLALGDRVPLAMGKASGVIAYCSFGAIAGRTDCPEKGVTESQPNDLALLRVDDADRAKVHPAMLGFGGPTRLATEVRVGDGALTYGNTDLRDARQEALPDRLDARSGRVASTSEWTTHVLFDLTGLPGDSGSPALLRDGAALGVVQTLQVKPCAGGRPEVNGIVNLSRALLAMEEMTDLRVELKTWPLLAAPGPLALPTCA